MKNILELTASRQAAKNILAVVGFVALVAAGMWSAVYSTRFVPDVVGRIGSAAVYLGSVFNRSTASLSVVPTPIASSTISRTATTTETIIKPASPVTTGQDWTPGTPVVITNNTDTSSIPVTPQYSGLSDLAIEIETVGYTTADGKIIATTTIPAYTQGAVKFRVTNVGTNVSGSWTMNISVPERTYVQTLGSLAPFGPSTPPNEYIAYFINVAPGVNRPIVITIDPNHQLTESSVTNNVASTSVTILGS